MVEAPHAQPETVVVTLPGEIDMANADRVGKDLEAAFGPGVGVVVADMSGTRFCDTSGIGAMVLACQRAQARHAGCRVVAGPGRIRRVWETPPGHGDSDLPRPDKALVTGDRKTA